MFKHAFFSIYVLQTVADLGDYVMVGEAYNKLDFVNEASGRQKGQGKFLHTLQDKMSLYR